MSSTIKLRLVVTVMLVLSQAFNGCGHKQPPNAPPAPEEPPPSEAETRRPDKAAGEPRAELPDLSHEEVLSQAEDAARKLGFTLPDKTMMQGLRKIGFVPKVVAVKGGWRVSYPLGHPWAVSWIHLELDSSGRLLNHKLEPGQ